RYTVEEFGSALQRVTVAARGPKPVAILHELGVKPAIRIPEPNTWREMLPIMATRPERRITIQEYGRPNEEFLAALRDLGAEVSTVCVYGWELPDDIGPLKEAVRRITRGLVDVVVFTTSIQFTHLLEVAANLGLREEVLGAFRDSVAVASVGPVMSAVLEDGGVVPDIVPEHTKMAALVRAAADESAAVVARKRRQG